MKRIISLFMLLICLVLPVFATDSVSPYVVDDANLLSESEYWELSDVLEEISRRLQMDVVVVTSSSLDGKSAKAYADDFYDYNGYAPDGVLLLVSMAERKWHITTTGKAISALTDGELALLEDWILPGLSSGDYTGAFLAFAEGTERYASSSGSSGGFGLKAVVICLVIGVVIAFIVTGIMKSGMKTVQNRNSAAEYVRQGSLQVTHSRDIFLYRNVTRRVKPQNNGSTTHRSSSGCSHGGRGGSF